MHEMQKNKHTLFTHNKEVNTKLVNGNYTLISPTYVFKWQVSHPKIFGLGFDYHRGIIKLTYTIYLLGRYKQTSSKFYM